MTKTRIITTCLAAMLSASAMAQMNPECAALMEQHNQHLSQGQTDKAIACAQKAKDAYQKAGAQLYHNDYISMVLQLGQEYSAAQNHKKAVECFNELAGIMASNNHEHDINYAVLCDYSADEYFIMGDMEASISKTISLFASLCRMEGVDFPESPAKPDWQYPASLATRLLQEAGDWEFLEFQENPIFNNAGVRLFNSKQYETAAQLLELTIQKMREKGLTTPELKADYITASANLHNALQATGNRQKDYQYMKEAIELAEQSGIADNYTQRMKADFLNLKAGMDTEPDKKKMDLKSLDDLIVLTNKAYASSMFTDVIKYGEMAINLIKKDSKASVNNYQSIFNYTGNAYIKTGDPRKAIGIYNQLLSILEDNNDRSTGSYAVVLSNIATIYDMLQDYDNEIEFRLKAMRAIMQNEQMATAQNNFKSSREEFAALTSLIISNLDNFKTISSNDMAISAVNNCNLLISIQNPDKAKALLTSIIEKLDETIGRNSVAGYRALENLGSLAFDNKEYSEALSCFEAAELITIAVYGDNSYERANVLVSMSQAYSHLNQCQKQLEILLKAEPIIEAALGPKSTQYIRVERDITNAMLLCSNTEGAASYFGRWLSLIKEQIHDYFSFMTIKEKSDYYANNIEPIASTAAILAHKLGNDSKYTGLCYDFELLSKGLLLSSENAFNNYIRHSGNRGLQSLYEQYTQNGLWIKQQARNPEPERDPGYAAMLSENSNLGHRIMEMCAEAADLSQNISTSWQDVRKALRKNDVAIEFVKADDYYFAMVLTAKSKSPDIVGLFKERDLKIAIADAAANAQCPFEQMPYLSTAMYQIIWKPLEKYMEPGCNVYFAPKGILHTMGIEYAPIGGDSLFCSRYDVRRISSTRIIPASSKTAEATAETAVIFGGIEYSYGTDDPQDAQAARGGSIAFLPGSLKEMEDISACLMHDSISVTQYSGKEATSSKLADLSGQDVGILHIATHGIFRDSDDSSLDNSGLAFADKILNSSEISQIDLAATSLVVLSACETAKGHISGEGVFGLQRAFKLTGAQSIIMSLWPVNDKSTQMMMSEFYSNIYSLGMSRREAFYKAVDSIRSLKGATPFNWAAFIMLD